jgi:hypothetical protein
MNREQNKSVEVLLERIIKEERNDKGGRRFLVRVLKFGDTNSHSVGFTKQWLSQDGKWLPSKTGHAFFPPEVWQALVEYLPEVNESIKTVLEENVDGRATGLLGPDARGSNVGRAYAPNASTITAATDNTAEGAVTDATATATSTSPNSEKFIAPTYQPKNYNANFTLFRNHGSSSNIQRGAGPAANVYRRGTKRGLAGQ